MRTTTTLAACTLGTLPLLAAAQPPAADDGPPPDWERLEPPALSRHRQLTSPREFARAGEAYFSANGEWIIFQATPAEAEGEAAEHYEMFVAPLLGAPGRPGLGPAVQVSRPGSANTCGWFHPSDPGVVLFGSTLTPPEADDDAPGYQRGTGRYRWSFPSQMEIVTLRVQKRYPNSLTAGEPAPLFSLPGYTAEGSWSPDGRHVLYAQIDPAKSEELGRPDADIAVYDTDARAHVTLVEAAGYDGGPFFGPIGAEGRPRWITYRSDRRGDNLLQLFIAELEYGDAEDPSKITGIVREVQITDNRHVNWAPYWHPSGRFLVYSTSEVSHSNYEVFAIEVLDEAGEPVTGAQPRRITHAAGFDGLPVFSPDGRMLMWTSQRGPALEGEERPSSQLWIASVDEERLRSLVLGPARTPDRSEAQSPPANGNGPAVEFAEPDGGADSESGSGSGARSGSGAGPGPQDTPANAPAPTAQPDGGTDGG